VQVVVENMAGAGHLIAQSVLYRTEPDGYTMLASANPELDINLIYHETPFGEGDLIPMVIQYIDTRILLVRKDSPWNSFTDFVEACEKEPGKHTLGVATNSGMHLLAQYLKDILNLDYQIVLYEGGAPAGTALLGGHIDCIIGEPYYHIRLRDETRALLLSSKSKDENWSEAQLLNEWLESREINTGYVPTFEKYQFILVRKELKEKYPERYQLLQKAIINAANNKEHKDIVEKMGWLPIFVYAPGEEYEEEMQSELEVIKKVDLTPQ
jgi:tripartite-type tricarboxylate transporter receptor subunit TctC